MDPKNEKIRMDLLPLPALQEVAHVMKLGASKYGEWNFRNQPVDPQVYTGAILRHLTKLQQGEENDPESGVSHWAHIAANALIMMSGIQTTPQPKVTTGQPEIAIGQRVKKGNVAGTIVGKTEKWYHIDWDDGKRYSSSFFYGAWEFQVVEPNK